MVEEFFNMLEKKGKFISLIEIKIRLDNAGENLSLQEEMNKSKWNIKFEFTAPNTPQQNGKVEKSSQH